MADSQTTPTNMPGSGSLVFRYAGRGDVPAIVALLADDSLGAGREEDSLAPYLRAFDDMQIQGGNHYLVAQDHDGEIVGCLQLTFIPGLSRSGAKRAQIEGVRVARNARGRGLGGLLVARALELAREHGCALAQLTTDHVREDALRFYESLGFENTHHGLKIFL